MKFSSKYLMIAFVTFTLPDSTFAQEKLPVKVVKAASGNKVNVYIADRAFTTFLYPDTLEKPVLYDVHGADGEIVTRGFPLKQQPGDPTDHPHHVGVWFTFENVNGLDFWNNSYAIPPEKKHSYGWIRTDSVKTKSDPKKGTLSYHANWTDQDKNVLLEENTELEFSGTNHKRIIDRKTTLTAATTVTFSDAKDGLYGIRLAHALEMPATKDQEFKDDKGNITVVKAGADKIPSGNYITSEGKTGDDAWSSRGRWCKVFGKIGDDSVSVAIIDHPKNPNYPTFWHARGYGLFAANPLGEKIFTNGKSEKNLTLHRGESVTFRFRIIIDDGERTISTRELDKLADNYADDE